ncbi:MAG TPA: DEAD/DEAH box helicase [Symbiobacteriaceae bacterium]|nr:DEAD/DEAH box helicase [Symbiobacteriaceae bacterium]
MITVHGSVVPFGASGFFFFWGIDRRLAPGARRRALALHPQAVAAEQLYPLLSGLPHVNAVACTIMLPDGAAKFPGLAISLGAAAQWLPDVERTRSFAFGQSLRTWSAAANLLLELLARGRFVPLLRAEAGCLSADWHLVAPEPEDADRLARLEAALPDVCRAIVPPDRSHKHYRPPEAGALISLFLRTGTGALARQFLEGVPDRPAARSAGSSAAQNWLLALTGQEGRDLPPGLPDAAALYEAVDEWLAPVSGERGLGALRTGLRLRPPADTTSAEWELELFVQNCETPPARVSARTAWDALGAELEIGGGKYRAPEQRLLADLPTLARLFPALEPLSSEAAPERLAISAEEVSRFLREGAFTLQEAGFPVLLPEGLVRPAALSAKLTVKPAGAAESRFGLGHLVEVDWELALGGSPIDMDELRRLAAQKRGLVEHQGRWVQVDPEAIQAALKNLEKYKEPVTLGTALRTALAHDKKAPVKVEAAKGQGWVADLLTRLQEPATIEPVPPPQGLQGTLRPYQQRGLDWLAFLRRYGLGACLADDMGLGKTIQLIALILHEREQGLTEKPTLIICPVSLVGNWRRELARFAPSLRVMVFHGAGRSTLRAAEHDVVITTYTLAAREEEALKAVQWAGVIADEAQALKNPSTQHAKALRHLHAEYRVACTGTPVENHLGDLWSLLAFVNPGFLGAAEEFRKSYALPIERFRDEEAAARLKRLVQPMILRRLKTDQSIIADLPEKLEMVTYANLTMEQAALYEAAVQETLEKAEGAAGIARHGAVVAGLTRLKQICNHPACLRDDAGPLEGRSGKLDRLTEMLEEGLAEGDRALVFTQFSSFGRRMEAYLARRLGCPVLFLDGSTSRSERDALVQQFQDGEAPVFVLSLKAGGVGLNLTAANRVFHFDRWWNPAVEDQATDRAYRIGQTKQVLVHKLVTAGTLEERIDELLSEKRQLSAQVVGTGEAWLGELSTDELRQLISLEREG